MRSRSLTSRRDFLKLTTSGLAGAALLSSGACSPQSKETPGKTRKIVYRTLGRTGLKLPIVSMGSCYAIDLVRTALDQGIVYTHPAAIPKEITSACWATCSEVTRGILLSLPRAPISPLSTHEDVTGHRTSDKERIPNASWSLSKEACSGLGSTMSTSTTWPPWAAGKSCSMNPTSKCSTS